MSFHLVEPPVELVHDKLEDRGILGAKSRINLALIPIVSST
jgi:hypothetical protein